MSRMLFSYHLFEAKIHSGAITIFFIRIHILIGAFVERVIKLNYMKSEFIGSFSLHTNCIPLAIYKSV